jgi:hypothetical protein
MRITYATEAAPGYVNEDRAVCGDGWAVVLDGATAPEGVDSGCIHDVSWLVNHLSAAIARQVLLDDGNLADMLAASIEETCKAHAGTCDLANPDSPSSTVSIVRVRDDVLEYLTLGDSPIVIRSPGAGIEMIADDRLAHLPGGRPYSRELVRSLRNKPGGFWVASTDPEAASHVVAGKLPFSAATEVGVFTDGASRLAEFYGYGWERIFSVLETTGPARMIAIIRDMERDRPPALGKQHDDATAVLLAGERVEPVRPARDWRPANWRSLVGL